MKCDICKKEFKILRDVRRHKVRKHKIKLDFVCSFCGKVFDDCFKLGGHKVLCLSNPKKIKMPSFKNKKHTKESREKMSKTTSGNNHGGKCKWYEVDGQKLQGTWERDLAIKLKELKIKWIKVKPNNISESFYYESDIKHFYTPDFYLPRYDFYLEIKGYWWGSDKHKMDLVFKQNPNLKNRLYIIEKEKFGSLLLAKNKTEFLNLL